MTPKDEDKDFSAIGYKCIEICNELASKGLAFKFNLTFRTFSFKMDTTAIKAHPAQLPRRKSKSPGAILNATVVGRQREPSITTVNMSLLSRGEVHQHCAQERRNVFVVVKRLSSCS